MMGTSHCAAYLAYYAGSLREGGRENGRRGEQTSERGAPERGRRRMESERGEGRIVLLSKNTIGDSAHVGARLPLNFPCNVLLPRPRSISPVISRHEGHEGPSHRMAHMANDANYAFRHMRCRARPFRRWDVDWGMGNWIWDGP